MKPSWTSLFIGIVVAILLQVVPPAFGQAVNANLLGTVTDETNAVIPGATVTITEIATGISKSSNTNSSGNYDFEAIQPGTYTVSSEQTGFKRALS